MELPRVGEFGGDPAGPFEDGLPDEVRLRMKRIPTVVAILRQLDRVNYLLSINADAASAVQALYAVTSPYLKKVKGWADRWEKRPCAGVRIGDRWVPAPQPSDYGAWLELIMDGLTEAGVVFEETRISIVGPDRRIGPHGPIDEGPVVSVGPDRVEPDAAGGAGIAASGELGGRFDPGPSRSIGSLGVRVQPGRRPKRSVSVDPGAPGLLKGEKKPQGTPVEGSGGAPGGLGARVRALRGHA